MGKEIFWVKDVWPIDYPYENRQTSLLLYTIHGDQFQMGWWSTSEKQNKFLKDDTREYFYNFGWVRQRYSMTYTQRKIIKEDKLDFVKIKDFAHQKIYIIDSERDDAGIFKTHIW